jgi:hypothetical protein
MQNHAPAQEFLKEALNKSQFSKSAFPQGLKPIDYAGIIGTTEVVPFQNRTYSEVP